MPSGPGGSHLFVVLNDPKQFPGYGPESCVVLVNVSTIPKELPHDPTCLIQAGCHAFVKHESYIAYRHARVETVQHLISLVRKGLFQPHDPMPSDVLTRIREGLQRSPFTKREFKQLPI